MNRCDSGRMCKRNQKGETGFVQLGGRGEVKRHARDSNMYIEREVYTVHMCAKKRFCRFAETHLKN